MRTSIPVPIRGELERFIRYSDTPKDKEREQFECLLQKYRNYEKASNYYGTLLQMLLFYNSNNIDIDMYKATMLLKAGANINVDPTYYSVMIGYNSITRDKLTPFMLLLRQHHIPNENTKTTKRDMADLFIRYGANIHARSGEFGQYNALYWCLNDMVMVDYLLQRGVKPLNMFDIYMYLRPSKYETFIKLCVKHGVDLNEEIDVCSYIEDNKKAPPLYWFLNMDYRVGGGCSQNHIDFAQLLLENGAEINSEIADAYTLLSETKRYEGILKGIKPYFERYYEQQSIFKRARIGEPEEDEGDVSEDEADE